MRKLLAILFLIVLSACASQGTKFDMADVEAMQPGVTTYDQAVEKLGKPKAINFAADGSKTAMWVWVQVVVGSLQSRGTKIQFDRDGKMVRIMSKVE